VAGHRIGVLYIDDSTRCFKIRFLAAHRYAIVGATVVTRRAFEDVANVTDSAISAGVVLAYTICFCKYDIFV